MARITIEDCKKEVPNRFELVVLAAQRARGISAGQRVVVNVLPTSSISVIALKEILSGSLDIDKLRESFILSQHETNLSIDSIETKDIDVTLIREDIIQSEVEYDSNYDLIGNSYDDNFDNILLEKE